MYTFSSSCRLLLYIYILPFLAPVAWLSLPVAPGSVFYTAGRRVDTGGSSLPALTGSAEVCHQAPQSTHTNICYLVENIFV